MSWFTLFLVLVASGVAGFYIYKLHEDIDALRTALIRANENQSTAVQSMGDSTRNYAKLAMEGHVEAWHKPTELIVQGAVEEVVPKSQQAPKRSSRKRKAPATSGK